MQYNKNRLNLVTNLERINHFHSHIFYKL